MDRFNVRGHGGALPAKIRDMRGGGRWHDPSVFFIGYFALCLAAGEFYPFSRFNMYAFAHRERKALIVRADGAAADLTLLTRFSGDRSSLRSPATRALLDREVGFVGMDTLGRHSWDLIADYIEFHWDDETPPPPPEPKRAFEEIEFGLGGSRSVITNLLRWAHWRLSPPRLETQPSWVTVSLDAVAYSDKSKRIETSSRTLWEGEAYRIR